MINANIMVDNMWRWCSMCCSSSLPRLQQPDEGQAGRNVAYIQYTLSGGADVSDAELARVYYTSVILKKRECFPVAGKKKNSVKPRLREQKHWFRAN